jgi:hypothetical protein
MLRLLGMILRPAVVRAADRLIRHRGADALDMARHAARAHDEQNWRGYWASVLHEVERRSRYRPW